MAIARYKIKTLDGDVAYGDGAGFVFPGSGTSWAVVFHTETDGDYTVSEDHVSLEAAQDWLRSHSHAGDGGVILIEIDDY